MGSPTGKPNRAAKTPACSAAQRAAARYFVSNSWLVVAIGVGLMAVPYFVRL
ncbi:MAG TPA: hypothetical protein VHF02_04530 [Luteimonas sp.]|nr:hypothetical protein [Luteimonas sp.]